MGKIVLVTGGRQVGKSSLCRRVAAELRGQGVQVTGLITQRVATHALMVTELETGVSYALTRPLDAEGLALPNFTLDPQAMERAAAALRRSFPTQLFVLDEVGPLEMMEGKGWGEVFDLLRRERYDVAMLVVRPELLYAAITCLPNALYTVVRVSIVERERLPQAVIRWIRGQLAGREV